MERDSNAGGSAIDWDFVSANLKSDPVRLRLRYCGKKGADSGKDAALSESILQIECRRRYSGKFANLLSEVPRYRFPSQIAAEQASHVWVSILHAALAHEFIRELQLSELTNQSETSVQSDPAEPEHHLIDMTAGLGVDFIAIARSLTKDGNRCVAIELDPLKHAALNENLPLAALPQAKAVNADSMEAVAALPDDSCSLIFADPARRGEGDSRIYDPRDCMPDVVGGWSLLLAKARAVMVKNSPMLDVAMAVKLYPGVVKVVIVSVKNECKEVLVMAGRDGRPSTVECVNILGCEGEMLPSSVSRDMPRLMMQRFTVPFSELGSGMKGVPVVVTPVEFETLALGESPVYLYEPNAGVMKVQPWITLLREYPDMKKLSPNCHIFISPILYEDFPGKIFRMEKIIGKSERKALKGSKMNVATRNYPERPEAIAKALRTVPGGNAFLYGVTVGETESPRLLQLSLR